MVVRSVVIAVAGFAVVLLHDWYIAGRDLTYIGTRGYYKTFVWLYVGGGAIAGVWLASGIRKFRRPMCLQAPTVAATSMVFLLLVAIAACYALDVLRHIQAEVVGALVAVSAVTGLFVCFRLAPRIADRCDT